MPPLVRPDATEAAPYFFTYIDKVDDGDIVETLRLQAIETEELYRSIPDDRSRHRYADGKWSIREVAAHVNDCERLFVFRALWFARGLPDALPGFDQEAAADGWNAHGRSWPSHVREFTSLRASTVAFFEHLPDDAWRRTGTASGSVFSVRALAFVTAGHVAHHLELLHERYL